MQLRRTVHNSETSNGIPNSTSHQIKNYDHWALEQIPRVLCQIADATKDYVRQENIGVDGKWCVCQTQPVRRGEEYQKQCTKKPYMCNMLRDLSGAIHCGMWTFGMFVVLAGMVVTESDLYDLSKGNKERIARPGGIWT